MVAKGAIDVRCDGDPPRIKQFSFDPVRNGVEQSSEVKAGRYQSNSLAKRTHHHLWLSADSLLSHEMQFIGSLQYHLVGRDPVLQPIGRLKGRVPRSVKSRKRKRHMKVTELQVTDVPHITFDERIHRMLSQEILVLTQERRSMLRRLAQRHDDLGPRKQVGQQIQSSDIVVVLRYIPTVPI